MRSKQTPPENGQGGPQGAHDDAPSLWTVYFEVENCDKTAENARKLGGDSVTPPMDIPNVGRFVILKDPEGAPFAVITNTPQS